MTQALKHELYVRGDREQRAKQDFVAGLRAYVLNDMASSMKTRWETEIEPREERRSGSTPDSGPAVHKAMRGDDYFRFYSSLRVNAQEMVWRSVIRPLNERLDELNARAGELAARAEALGGSLELDPSLEVPGNVADFDVHLAPGGYHTEQAEDDCGAGALYDHGLNIFSFGMMGANLDDIGHSMANYVRLRYPDFAPRDVLDLGCTVGHNTDAWKLAYPEATVTGIDVAAPCLRYAHARAGAQGVAVHFKQMNATDLAFDDESFDVVFSSMFLHELPRRDVRAVFDEAYRVLRPGGLFLNMELPPNDALEPYDAFYLDWDAYYNNEPYYKQYRDLDLDELRRSAGFAPENFVSFITPQYTYMSEDDYRREIAGEAGFGENTGRLAAGVQWFGFGAWK